MSAPEALLALMWVGVTLYAVFGGADFGAGVWDLLAGGARAGARQRAMVEHSIGPVWEANHVWLIFVLVTLWTGFPRVFASVMATLYVPLTAAAVGVIARGAGFAFRKSVPGGAPGRVFGAVFAGASLLTPFFLGTVAGAVASGRVPEDAAGADRVGAWLNPTSALGGTLAVCTCAYLAAVFLAADAARVGDGALVDRFRRAGMAAAVATGAVALAGVAVLRADAPLLFAGLTRRALPLVLASAAGGLWSVGLLAVRRFRSGRLAAVAAVAAVMWGWAVGQYPDMLVGRTTIAEAAGSPATVTAVLVCLLAGSVIVVPPLVALLWLSGRGHLGDDLDDDRSVGGHSGRR